LSSCSENGFHVPEASLDHPATVRDECVISRLPAGLHWLQMCENHSLMVTERVGSGWGTPPDH
jgi:hypothetical protein